MALARRSGLALLLAGATLAGCAGKARPIELSVNRDPASADFGAVEVWGLTASVRKALAQVPPDDPRWSGAVGVSLAARDQAMPPLAGRYAVTKECVRFVPRYRPEGPLSYRVRLDPAALARLAGRSMSAGQVREWSYELPGRTPPPSTTRVTGIYPSAPVIPANQLRWYVEFSAPMREGEAARHAHLVDQRGVEVDRAFLTVQEELWDRDRRRITLFFDMGRVKRAIRTRVEQGPVLHPGGRYVLRIDRNWRDARGAPLVDSVVHPFLAGPEDHTAVLPARWRLDLPAIGTRSPLRVDFGEPLDHALASHLIAVTGSEGSPVSGEVRLGRDDRSWEFTPDAPWFGERYQLRVHPALEDLSGNRVGYVFDADLNRGERAGVDSAGAVLEFLPTGERGTR
jgi:hypothetical protein